MWRPERWIATLLTMPAIRSSALRCASVALAAILLTGCTSEAAPAPTAPATTAATPAVSPSPSPAVAAPSEPAIEKITTPPRVPADLTTPGKVGSKAAVEYFVALYGYTLNTGDTSLLRGMSAPMCEYCSRLIADVEADKAAGLDIAGDGASISTIRMHERESSEVEHLWLMSLSFSPFLVRSAGDEIDVEPKTRELTAGLIATWDGASWRISEYVDVIESGSQIAGGDGR